jgi:hypothetical protein
VTTTEFPAFEVGALVQARGREWVVLPQSEPPRFLVLRPLGSGDDEVAGVFPTLEQVSSATFEAPDPGDVGTAVSAGLLRTALRIGFRASAGPFRSLARLAVEPRAYQLVPLLMALRQDTVRLLIADDVGIGKTIEAGLTAVELLEQGDATGLAVLCGPAPVVRAGTGQAGVERRRRHLLRRRAALRDRVGRAHVLQHLHRPLVQHVGLGQIRGLRARTDQQMLHPQPGQQHRRGQARTAAAHNQNRDFFLGTRGDSHGASSL